MKQLKEMTSCLSLVNVNVSNGHLTAPVDKGVIFRYLVEIFAGEEGLVAGVSLEQGGEGAGLLALLPGCAAAVSLQGVVGDAVVVGVLPRQDAGSAGAAERTGHKLRHKQTTMSNH